MDSINFRANHIKNVNIAKRYKESYKPYKVALVEMSPNNPQDINAVKKTIDNWGISFTEFTYDDMKEALKNKDLLSRLHVFALTKQKLNYDKMKSSDILGVVEFKKGYYDGNKIEALQTNPHYINNNLHKNSQFKNIGKKLINYVKKEYNHNPLYVHPTETAIPFYENLGFKQCHDSKKINTWCITP